MQNEPMFPDVPFSHPQRIEIEMMAAAGIMQGRSDGTFGPDKPLTRAEAAEMAFLLLSQFYGLK